MATTCAMRFDMMERSRPRGVYRNLRDAEEYGLSQTTYSDADAFTLKSMHIVRDQFAGSSLQNTQIIYSAFDLNAMMAALFEKQTKQTTVDGSTFDEYEIWGGSYKKVKGKYVYIQQDLDEMVCEKMHQRLPICIMMDFGDYSVEKQGKQFVETAHSVMVFMIPSGESKYNMYYANSHGCDVGEYKAFDLLDGQNKTTLTFERPCEFVLLEEIAAWFQTSYDFIYSEWGSSVTVCYDDSSAHNYLGPNLQEGDEYGMCFIYPIIIFYNWVMYYDVARNFAVEKGEFSVAPLAELMANGYFTEMIAAMFMEYSPEYTRLYGAYLEEFNHHDYGKRIPDEKHAKLLGDFTNDLNCTLEEEHSVFIRNMVDTLIRFIKQPFVSEKLDMY